MTFLEKLDKIPKICPKKPWWQQVQIFTPWSSLYIGIQLGNHFFGVQVRKPEEPS